MQLLSQFHKDLGVVYTPEILVSYICKTTIHQYIIERLNTLSDPKIVPKIQVLDIEKLDPSTQKKILEILTEITILDPAVGGGYFLMSSFDVLEEIHIALIKAKVQKKAITDVIESFIIKSLFGVDISLKAVNLCLKNLNNYIKTKYPMIDQLRLENSLKKQIKNGNALIGNKFGESVTSNEKEGVLNFNWEREFPTVYNAGGFSICVGNPPWNTIKPLEKEFFSQFDSNLSKYGVDKQTAKTIISNLLKDEDITIEWNNYRADIQKQTKYFKKYYQYQSGKIKSGKTFKKVSGDLNLYKLFLERSFHLLQENGTSGLIIPSGIHNDAGTKGLRTLFFEQNQVRILFAFENRQGIFPGIHKSFKFDILIYQKNCRKTDFFQSTFMRKDPEFLLDKNAKFMKLSWQEIKEYSPSSWSILEFKTDQDLYIVKKMYRFPVIGDSIVFAREFDMTMDSQFFNTEGKGLPLYEGKMIQQFTHKFKKPRFWIEEKQIIDKFSASYKNFRTIRLVFRAVAASTNQRTMISTFLPANCCCGNSLIIINEFIKEGKSQSFKEDLLFLSGVFNSYVFDYLLRLKISQNLNMFFIRDMPLPVIRSSDPSFQKLIKIVSSIYLEYEEFRLHLNQNDPDFSQISKISLRDRQALIDAEVAKLYGLSSHDLEYILDQFHIRDSEKEKNLIQQKRLILEQFRVN